MHLYRVEAEEDSRYVEAADFASAEEIFQDWWQSEYEDSDIATIKTIDLMDADPVLRAASSEQQG